MYVLVRMWTLWWFCALVWMLVQHHIIIMYLVPWFSEHSSSRSRYLRTFWCYNARTDVFTRCCWTAQSCTIWSIGASSATTTTTTGSWCIPTHAWSLLFTNNLGSVSCVQHYCPSCLGWVCGSFIVLNNLLVVYFLFVVLGILLCCITYFVVLTSWCQFLCHTLLLDMDVNPLRILRFLCKFVHKSKYFA